MTLTKAQLQAELRRFHMRCGRCGTVSVPQLLPSFDPVELVRLFIREHAACPEPKRPGT